MKKAYLKQLLQTQDDNLQKLHDIVHAAIEEENLLSQKLCEDNNDTTETFGNRVSDKVAAFGGSWKVIILFGVMITVWIFSNIVFLANQGFDPYPFILLNLILSCVAALQAPVIMMSQNRQEEKDRKRAENDYLINLKAEVEIRHLHKKIDLAMTEHFKHFMNIQQKQIELLEELKNEVAALKKDKI
jgi:uncharacterized membrane protein